MQVCKRLLDIIKECAALLGLHDYVIYVCVYFPPYLPMHAPLHSLLVSCSNVLQTEGMVT
jgi:hypothetical protein